MAKGDTVVDVQDISSGASLDFQPGSGVNVVIHEAAAEAAVIVKMIDGTLVDSIVKSLSAGEDRRPMKLLTDNANYLRITEASAATRNIGYSGVQTK